MRKINDDDDQVMRKINDDDDQVMKKKTMTWKINVDEEVMRKITTLTLLLTMNN
jgi:hypothetical protein